MADQVNEEDKKFPNATEGIAGLLNITPHGNTGPRTDSPEPDSEAEPYTLFADKTVPAPSNLPIGDLPADLPTDLPITEPITKPVPAKPKTTPTPKPVLPSPDTNQTRDAILTKQEPKTVMRGWRIAKKVLPFVALFIIFLGLYYFYFNNFSFTNLFNSKTLTLQTVTNSNTNKEYDQLKKDAAADYAVWLNQFFADVNDDSISSMDADVSGNGLTNFEKYLLNLNPKVYSTSGGAGDGELVLQGTNPWTGQKFTDQQKQLVDKYLNPELISNRITAAAITRGVTKYAQYVNPDSPYYIDPVTLQKVGSNGQPIVSPTQISTNTPANVPTNQQPNNNTTAPSTNLRPEESIDQSKTALLEIPANKISVPLTWTQDVKDFEADLKKGVVHYPGTAMLGDPGTAYISGHSSGYIWDKSPYKQIFATLGDVKDGTSFSITATLKNGKTAKFDYVIDHRGEYAANDQAQFLSTSDSVVALSTCWPVNTTARRLVLFGKLTQIEKS